MSRSNTQTVHQVYGINGSMAVLKHKNFEIITIDILKNGTASKNSELKELLNNHTAITKQIPKDIFKNRYSQKHTQGIAVKFKGDILKQLPSLKNVQGNYCLLMIDNITDPQNFGQIIRTAECAGINGIIIPQRNSVGVTDTVLQISQGAFCYIDLYSVTNFNQTLNALKDDGFWSVALENSINAENWKDVDYSGKIIIIVGSEGEGIKPLVLKNCDFQATIPMQGSTTSLNVSASVAAIAFERLRQLI